MNAWLILAIAILFEVAGTTCMRLSEGFTKPIPSVLLFVFYIASFTAITFALDKIPLSIAYAVWAALGTAIIAVIGMFYFQEGVTAVKIASLALIIVGVVGLKLSAPDTEAEPPTSEISAEP